MPEQQTFSGAVQALKSWSNIRALSSREVEELKAQFLEPDPKLKDLWESATLERVGIQSRYEAVDWKAADGQSLALLVQGHCEINAAVQKFLPATFSISWTGAHALFAFSLVRTSLRLERPLDLLRCYAEFYYGGRCATGEVVRRIFCKDSFDDSFWPVLGSHFISQDQQLQGADVILEQSLKAVAQSAQGQVRNWQNVSQKDIVAQAAETIWKKWGNSVEALAEWLNGNLNLKLVSRSVANACIDEQRKHIPPPIAELIREANKIANRAEMERRQYTERLEEIADEITDLGQQIDKSGLDGVESIADRETPEEIVSTKERLSGFIEEYPKERARITEDLDDIPNKALAKAKGISESATSQKLAKAHKTFLKHFKK